MDESIGLDEEWKILEEGIAKAATMFLEGDMEMQISPEEFIKYYTVSIESYDYCEVIYDRYKLALEKIVSSTVLPYLMDKRNEFLLEELLRMWSNYQKMTIATSHFLAYLGRYYIPFSSRPPLKTVAASCFFNMVFPPGGRGRMIESVCDAVVSLMNREREGQQISHDLINSFMAFIVDGITILPNLYEFHIETALRDGAIDYYSLKGFAWFMSCTFTYVTKYEECLRREAERALRYMTLSEDFRRQYYIQIIDKTLEEAFMNAFQTKMTDIALRSAYSCYHSAFGGARPLQTTDRPTWISMMEAPAERRLRMQHAARQFRLGER